MSITELSTEILQKIYEYAAIKDVLNLSQTSRKNYNAFIGRQLPILRKAIYNSPYSPFPELVQLVISSAPDTTRNKSLGTEMRRRNALDRVIHSSHTSPLSLDFIKSMTRCGEVASRWSEIYPQLRWRYDSSSRRLLRPHEAQRVRKAIYQQWTYQNLFCDAAYCKFAPEVPRNSYVIARDDMRFVLARTWSTVDMVRQSEWVASMRALINTELFPSEDMVNYAFQQILNAQALKKLAWGGDYTHQVLSEALLKLNPEEMLHLYLHTTTKPQRLAVILAKGHWFPDTPSTWNEVVHQLVVRERTPRRDWVVHLPSTKVWRPPYIGVADQAVEFGMIDEDTDKESIPGLQVYSGDAIPSGEFVHIILRPILGTIDDSESSEVEDA